MTIPLGFTILGVPQTLSIFSVVGALVSGVGAIRQGSAQQASLNFQAAVQRQQADRERQAAEGREEDFRRLTSGQMARRRAVLGASGVRPGAGSPLLVSEDFAAEAELQALRIRSGGALRATRLEQSAQLNVFQGTRAREAGFSRGGSLLLSGFSSAFGTA